MVELTLKREQVQSLIQHELPPDVKVSKLSFFSKKVVITGTCNISRKNQLIKTKNRIQSQSGWQIVLKLIYLDGQVTDPVIDEIIANFPAAYEIDQISVDLNARKVTIDYHNPDTLPPIVIENLNKIALNRNFKFIFPSSTNTGLLELSKLIDTKKDRSPESPSTSNQIIINKIKSLLPSWITDAKIKLVSKKNEYSAIVEVRNDFTDIERITMLEMLLESQIGFPVKIQQIYDINKQLIVAEQCIKTKISHFTTEFDQNNQFLLVKYASFPLDSKDEEDLKELVKKDAKVTLGFKNEYDPLPMNLAIKAGISELYPLEIEYKYVFFDSLLRKFIVQIPEENAQNLDLNNVLKQLEEKFKVSIDISNIEDNPTIYLRERIFSQSDESKNIKTIIFDSEKKYIKIECFDHTKIKEENWRKVLFRFTKFDITFKDQNTDEIKLKDFSYYNKLDIPDLTDLLLKILPTDLDIDQVIWNESTSCFNVKYSNLLPSADTIARIQAQIKNDWLLNVNFIPSRDRDDLIHSLQAELPDWIVQPVVDFENHVLLLEIENDYTDEDKLENFCNTFSQTHKVPIVIKFNLSISRIKSIIHNIFRELADLTRTKIYPEKSQIYLEGITKRDADDELIQEALSTLEVRTRYNVEAYFKPNYSEKKETVHEILDKLIENYELKTEFSPEVLADIDRISFDIEKELPKRMDLREWETFSIDPIGARAIDDAISIQRLTHKDKEDDFLVGIHIADVSAFIESNSSIDNEMRRRGQSIYLDTIYPMLPDHLNQQIGLIENRDRPALSMLIELSLEGEVINFWVKRTIITNKKQFTYEEVNEQLLEQKDPYLSDLQLFVSLTYQLRYQRIARGSFNLDIDFLPDDLADQIITELMILANRLMGYYMQNLPGQKVFRNQHIPSYAFSTLSQMLDSYGYHIDLLNKSPLMELNRVVSEAATRNEHKLILRELRSFLSNAYYSHNCNGHESLGTKWYTHWTSPLRRYIDTIVGRLVTNTDVFIDDLVSICQYQSAIERYAKIKSEINSIQVKLAKLGIIKDKVLSASLHTINRKQIVFLLKSINAYAIIKLLNNPDVIYLESENGIELIGKLILEGDSVDLQIYEVIQEKKDIIIRIGLLTEGLGNSGKSVMARLLYLD